MKTILLKLDREFFYKMKDDKSEKEKKTGMRMSWEDYIKLIFGFSQKK